MDLARIKDSFGLNLSVFAQKCGVGYAHLTMILKGRRAITDEAKVKILNGVRQLRDELTDFLQENE